MTTMPCPSPSTARRGTTSTTATGVNLYTTGEIYGQVPSTGTATDVLRLYAGNTIKTVINGAGDATFGGNVVPARIEFAGAGINSRYISSNVFSVSTDGTVKIAGTLPASPNIELSSGGEGTFFRVNAIRTDAPGGYAITAGDSNNAENAIIRGNGAATFAGGNAGFTTEGYLWCTTQSGDTVVLNSVSGGTATWASYTPPTRAELIKEGIEQRPSTKPIPE